MAPSAHKIPEHLIGDLIVNRRLSTTRNHLRVGGGPQVLQDRSNRSIRPKVVTPGVLYPTHGDYIGQNCASLAEMLTQHADEFPRISIAFGIGQGYKGEHDYHEEEEERARSLGFSGHVIREGLVHGFLQSGRMASLGGRSAHDADASAICPPAECWHSLPSDGASPQQVARPM